MTSVAEYDVAKMTSARLLMRRAETEDIEAIAPRLVDPERTKYMGFRQPLDRAGAFAFLQADPPWLFLTRDGDRYVLMSWIGRPDSWGCVTVHNFACGEDFGLGEAALVLEAARLGLRCAFARFGARRIQSVTPESNRGAVWLAEKAGMQREGVARSAAIVCGQPEDVVQFGILASEVN